MKEYDGCSEPKMREVERAFFAKNKIDIELKERISGVRIPLPTEGDLNWAKKIYKSGHKAQTQALDTCVEEQNIWRTAFLLQIPYTDKFVGGKGIADFEKNASILLSLKTGNHDTLSLLMSSPLRIYGSAATKYVKKATSGQLKIMLKHNKDTFLVENDHYSSMRSAISCGSLDKVKMLYEHGGDIFTNSEKRIELALKRNKPEIARFLKEEIAKKKKEAGLEDPTENPALPCPGNRWEKIGDDEIAKHRIFDQGKQQISDIFNFSSQQITHIYTHLTQKNTEVKIQNFADVQNPEYIESAAAELQKQGGMSSYTSDVPHSERRVHKLHIKPQRTI